MVIGTYYHTTFLKKQKTKTNEQKKQIYFYFMSLYLLPECAVISWAAWKCVTQLNHLPTRDILQPVELSAGFKCAPGLQLWWCSCLWAISVPVSNPSHSSASNRNKTHWFTTMDSAITILWSVVDYPCGWVDACVIFLGKSVTHQYEHHMHT